jgi:CheY-like chemotaxis protein
MDDSKILIVEDDFVVALDLKQRLEDIGHKIVGIEGDGEAAIKKTNKTKPDLILMDITLKGELDGIETAQKIQENNDIPLIYVSGYIDKKTLKRAKITKPLAYITKPFVNSGLLKAIRSTV